MTSTIINNDGRTCTDCRVFQPWENFSRDTHLKWGRRPRCKGCVKVYDANHHKTVRTLRMTPEEKLAKSLQQTGVTIEWFTTHSDRSDGCCYACGNKPQDGRRLAVDHCHETDTIRGLLCVQCNTALGLLKDDPRRLQALIEYLANPPLAA